MNKKAGRLIRIGQNAGFIGYFLLEKAANMGVAIYC
jgi:hypothetical protein